MPENNFATRLLQWFDLHGRHDLPWQRDINPYRVWVSEVMLQQTQVATVIPYYDRFMRKLPTVQSLAEAEEDTVLQLWSGLGYYSRARNLQRCAKIVVEQHHSDFPKNVDDLCALPGIGRSTAGAIASIAFDQRAPILDGNVKRVLARHDLIDGWPGNTATAKALWALAERYTPSHRVADYTQAIMDLGATLCTRSKPLCVDCPLNDSCQAHAENRISEFPGKKPRKALPTQLAAMIMLVNTDGHIWLEKRPDSGIWAGLWSFPQVALDSEQPAPSEAASYWLETQIPSANPDIDVWPRRRHTFSHYHLEIHPLAIAVTESAETVREADHGRWTAPEELAQLGLAAPIKRLLDELLEQQPK